MGVDLITCHDCKNDVAIINAVGGRCKPCTLKRIQYLETVHSKLRTKSVYHKVTLFEASYRISNEQFKKIPRTKTVGFIRGHQKAATIAHDVLKKMIEGAK